jgi:hypothetical protein
MKKHTSEEAYYERLRNLSKVNEASTKQSLNRNLGTLIDYKRASDGVAYGIIKEQHHYYVKKAGLKQDPNVADFAYIGGLSNIKDFEYKSLSEAEKQRNMLFCTINEAVALKTTKKVDGKKKRLNEDKAGEEIDASAEMAAGLDAAADAAQEVPAEPAMDLGGAETPAPEPAPEAGLEGGGEMPAEEPAPEAGLEGGEEMPAPEGGEEAPAEEPAPEEEVPAEEPVDGEAPAGGEEKDITTKEIEKSLGKLTNKLRQTELTDSQVKSYVNSFLAAFKDKFPDVEIEDRKAMAEKITKVVPDEEIEDLGQNVEATEDTPVPAEEPVGVEEGQCSECGGFAKYAESRGYNAQSIQECGEEEMSNLVSGYANAHNDGQNDGDFKAVALFITPEILSKLQGDYGHDEYAEKLTPYVNQLGECGLEEKQAQINELFGSFGAGMKNVLSKGAEKVGGAIQKGAEKVGTAASDLYKAGAEKVGDVKKGIQNVAGQVKQAYHTGALSNEMKKANELGNQFANQIIALNQRAQKAGQELNTQSLLSGIANQIKSGKPVNVAGTTAGGALRTSEGLDDVAKTEVQPIAEVGFAPAAQTLGVVTAPTTVKEDVKITDTVGDGDPFGEKAKKAEVVSESEQKLRKYIRARLEEKAGLKKPVLTESKKSENLKKLDAVIDKQYQLFESQVNEMGVGANVGHFLGIDAATKAKIKDDIQKIDPNDVNGVNKLFFEIFGKSKIRKAVVPYIKAATAPEKHQLLMQASQDPDGIGVLAIDGAGKLAYKPFAQVKWAAPTQHTFGSGGAN